MSTKTFTGAKKPARQPTPEEIAAFEDTGRALERRRKITAKAEKRESRKAESREHESTEVRDGGNQVSQKHGNPDRRKDDSAAPQKHGNTETSKAADTETRTLEAIVRLTIDLPESAHTRFKAACASTRRKMVDEVRDFIEQRTAELEGDLAGRR
ncbi:MAG: hypothetical protein Q8P46_18305 [Hyphomicrobiales bacterium]|nr:hypothetical protein [Hyphomicrobiales bacterium]